MVGSTEHRGLGVLRGSELPRAMGKKLAPRAPGSFPRAHSQCREYARQVFPCVPMDVRALLCRRSRIPERRRKPRRFPCWTCQEPSSPLPVSPWVSALARGESRAPEGAFALRRPLIFQPSTFAGAPYLPLCKAPRAVACWVAWAPRASALRGSRCAAPAPSTVPAPSRLCAPTRAPLAFPSLRASLPWPRPAPNTPTAPRLVSDASAQLPRASPFCGLSSVPCSVCFLDLRPVDLWVCLPSASVA